MTEDQPIAIVHWRLDAWFPNLSTETQEKLKIYRDELMKANKLISLISVKTIFAADAIHFADSIMACQIIQEADPAMTEIYDLGSGNGFPGLIYALLFPKVKVVLVESELKKADYLKRMVDILALSNVAVRSIALETLPAN